MKPKLKPIFLIFVVLVSFVVVSRVDGLCVGDIVPNYCEDLDDEECIVVLGCTWVECLSTDPRPDCPDLDGVCAGTQKTCTDGSWSECDDYSSDDYSSIVGATYQTPETRCDGLDNDCDGSVDENPDCDDYTGDGLNSEGVCTLKTAEECDEGEHFIMSLSDEYNAHASTIMPYSWQPTNDNNRILCCSFNEDFKSISSEKGSNCGSGDGVTNIIYLSDNTNAHVSTEEGYYHEEICLKTTLDDVKIECGINEGQVCSGDTSFCLFSLSDIDNAHVSRCSDDNFQYKVCCSITSELEDGQPCDAPEECKDEDGDGERHCVKGDIDIEENFFCRPTNPYTGDEYCYEGDETDDPFEDPVLVNQETGERILEDSLGATRLTDVASCLEDPICEYYSCSNGCVTQPLPAGKYPLIIPEDGIGSDPYLVVGETYPYPYTEINHWECNEFNSNEQGGFGMHCNGTGNCVTSCIDEDEDGYGIQPSPLYNADACLLGSIDLDCVDNGTAGSIDLIMNFNPFYINHGSLSPFCDCKPNTPDWLEDGGVTGGIPEGPIIIQIPIGQDFCFDGYDNDCDDTIDCSDLDCSPAGYIFPIRNRTCGVNERGESDCTEAYQTESSFDRACCPNPTDCVINGECVESGDLHGDNLSVHYCFQGQWYSGDTFSAVCDVVVNDSEYNTLDYSHWGLTGNAGNGSCCGDDLNEYFTKGAYASYACCDKPDMRVIGGKCVGSLTEVYTWDKTSGGYCLDDTQCLVNPNEVDFDKTVEDVTSITHYPLNKVRCINNGEFIGDHYCRNGEWTSRTALLIRQLMDIAGSSTDYSLFCDSYDNVLNFYGYVINEWYPAINYFKTGEFQCEIGKGNIVDCVNNICVLKYDENKVIIGASINHDIDASSYSILEALGGTNRDCSSVLDSNTFEVCGGGVYYNNKIKSVIYTRSEPSISDVLIGGEADYIRNLFEPTLYYLQYNTPPSYDYGFVNETHDFNKIFISKKGDKTIYIITEEVKNKKYMSATYSNFDTNICAVIENYKLNNPVLVPFDCVKQGNVFYVFTGGLTKGYYELLNDLGPKLRIK